MRGLKFIHNLRSGKYLLDSTLGYRGSTAESRRLMVTSAWSALSIIIVFASIAYLGDISGMQLLLHVSLVLIAVVPVGHAFQRFASYMANSPENLRLARFRIGKKNYHTRYADELTVLTEHNKKVTTSDENELELFFASISSFAKLPDSFRQRHALKHTKPVAYESGFLPNLHYARGAYGKDNIESTFIIGPLHELVPYTDQLWDHGHVRKLTPKDIATLQSTEQKWLKESSYTLGVAFLPHSHTENGARLDAETIKNHSIFVGLAALNNKRDTKLFAADIAHNIRVGNRFSAAMTIALLSTIVVSFVSVLFGWSPALLSIPLLVIFKLIVEGLPAGGLIWDGLFKHHGSQLEPHQSTAHSVWDGLIAGIIATGAFFAVFWWYGIAPNATEAQSILHGRALHSTFLTLTGVSSVILLTQRHTTGLFNSSQLHNRVLGVVMAFAGLIAISVVYTGLVTPELWGLNFRDFSAVVLAVCVFILTTELRRHTENTNSRNHLLQLLTQK